MQVIICVLHAFRAAFGVVMRSLLWLSLPCGAIGMSIGVKAGYLAR